LFQPGIIWNIVWQVNQDEIMTLGFLYHKTLEPSRPSCCHALLNDQAWCVF